MKLLLGKETLSENPNRKDHKISLEDDVEFTQLEIEPQILCFVSNEDAQKIIKFIRDTQILGVDNEAVKLMYKLKEDLIKKIEERKVENIIDTA